MKKILALVIGMLFCWNVIADNIELNPAHPDRYVVVKGDTLWDISARFLKTPWRWPDIWQGNSQIANPHLIYPGDIIELTFVDGQPRLSVKRGDKKLSPSIRRSNLDNAIPMIPIDAIAAFLNNPRIMSEDEYEEAPYVVAFDDKHALGSPGYKAYVLRLEESKVEDGHTVVRLGEEYKDGETDESLGFEAVFIAESTVVREGDPATIMPTKSTREVRKGDRVVPTLENSIVQNYYPHAPEDDIRGRIVGVVDGVRNVGKYNIVVIDRGQKDGVEVGHVLQIDQAGETIRDVVAGGSNKVDLPNEKAGVLMVFRVFDRVSYGLVMGATRALHRLDVVRTPQH